MNTTITIKSEQGGNPDQENHNPQLHRQNFRTQTQNSTPNPKLNPIFFHQLHRDKTIYNDTKFPLQSSNCLWVFSQQLYIT